jgi:hypothetical protein
MTKHITFLFLAVAFSLSANAQKMKPVFNGQNLNNWDINIGTALKGFEDLKAQASPGQVFSVVEKDGETLVRVSGDVNASLATKTAYENYHFRMEYKWGEKVYTTQNSGLLYHSFGPFGAGLGTWMSSIECQLMNQNLGDAYMMGDSYAEISVNKDGDQYVFASGSKVQPFGNEQAGGKIARKIIDNEKASNEWNVVEIYVVGQRSVHVVNGMKVMECNNIGKIINGKILPLSKGKIQIQSEGAEMFVRKAEIRKIKSIPDDL